MFLWPTLYRMRIAVRIPLREYHACIGRSDYASLMRRCQLEASVKILEPRIVRRDGAFLLRDDERDGYGVYFDGEPRPDLAAEHRAEWVPR